MSRSSGGRSAVSTISGTPASSASTTAGCRFAAAEPEVQRTAAGVPVARAVPSAKNPALRSSRITVTLIPGSRHRAMARGVEREPGEITARSTPERASSSAIAEASAVLRLAGSTDSNRSSVEPPRRKRVFVDLDTQARALVDDQAVTLREDAAADGGREQALGCQPVRNAGVAAPVPQRLHPVRGGSDSDRSLQRAGQVRGHHLCDLEGSAKAPNLGDLDRRDFARSQLAGTPGVEGRHQALVSRDPDLHPAPQLHHLLESAHRLLRKLDLVAGDSGQALGRIVDAPGTVGVDANRD